jgi:hypothetical protein
MAINVKLAAEKTKALLLLRLVAQVDKFKPEREPDMPSGLKHTAWMLERVAAGEVDGKAFSEARANRWLGWAQAMLYMRGGTNVDELKQINLEARSQLPVAQSAEVGT